jgi:hypothetical protein
MAVRRSSSRHGSNAGDDRLGTSRCTQISWEQQRAGPHWRTPFHIRYTSPFGSHTSVLVRSWFTTPSASLYPEREALKQLRLSEILPILETTCAMWPTCSSVSFSWVWIRSSPGINRFDHNVNERGPIRDGDSSRIVASHNLCWFGLRPPCPVDRGGRVARTVVVGLPCWSRRGCGQA